MSLVKAIVKAMERIAPLRLAQKWDNVGLLIESPVPKPHARRVLLTIDLTPAVLTEALASTEEPTSMIIAYHPPIFKPLSALTLANPLQASLLRCAAAGISVYSPHTALDAVWGGINDWLADGLVEASNNSATVGTLKGALDPNWQLEGGEGRVVEFDSGMEMRKVEEIIKKHLGVSQLQSAYGKSGPVKTIAICAGSGGSMLLGYEADVYWTGEMSHHEVLAAVAAGKNVILCGHTNTERGYLPILASKLKKVASDGPDNFTEEEKRLLSQMVVHVSKEDRHPLVLA